MLSGKRELLVYETRHGKVPFDEWLEHLKDRKARAVIRARLDRLEHGNAGKYESVGSGVCELKIHFGPGYRIYFGEDGRKIIVLLCGGDKGSQKKDIQNAHEYWMNYKESK